MIDISGLKTILIVLYGINLIAICLIVGVIRNVMVIERRINLIGMGLIKLLNELYGEIEDKEEE